VDHTSSGEGARGSARPGAAAVQAAHEANVLGALSLAVSGRIQQEAERSAAIGASAPAALVALDGYLTGQPIDALRRVLGLTHSGTVRLVDRLAAAGLVERRTGTADGRAVPLGLTPAGRRAARRVLAAREAALEEVLSALGAEERATLAALQDRLLAGMVQSGEDSRRICRLCDPVGCGHPDGRCPVTQAADAAEARALT
jgi:MarR family transcriptional repressor of emrRAB